MATRLRGKPIRLPLWWLRELWRLSVGYGDEELWEAIKRIKPEASWVRETIGNFRNNKNPTIEAAEAICELFSAEGLVIPFFVARTKDEALAMIGVQQEHSAKLRRLAEAQMTAPEAANDTWETAKMRKLLETGVYEDEDAQIADEVATQRARRNSLQKKKKRKISP